MCQKFANLMNDAPRKYFPEAFFSHETVILAALFILAGILISTMLNESQKQRKRTVVDDYEHMLHEKSIISGITTQP